MVYQMAQRESGCFLARRVADRGIDKNIGDSRVRGDRLNRDRRSAGRGNEIGNCDPRDIIQIKRLRQRVGDLEEIKRLQQRIRDLEEIRRLHQRVRDLELQREMRNMETESSTVVWDKGGDREQQPCSRHPHRFSEPTYPDFPSENQPQDEIEPDEEECSFVRKVLSGITVQEDEQVTNTDDTDCDARLEVQKYPTIFSGNFVEFLKEDKAFGSGIPAGVVEVALGGRTVIKEPPQERVEIPFPLPKIELKNDPKILEFEIGSSFQISEDIVNVIFKGHACDKDDLNGMNHHN
ncbi:hypothetical protein HanLR1_Chr07g0238311 [Helianthus annuus]|nr:hypothetical protein HanLR1_Chr07g0238311 [Helianthus annuus]